MWLKRKKQLQIYSVWIKFVFSARYVQVVAYKGMVVQCPLVNNFKHLCQLLLELKCRCCSKLLALYVNVTTAQHFNVVRRLREKNMMPLFEYTCMLHVTRTFNRPLQMSHPHLIFYYNIFYIIKKTLQYLQYNTILLNNLQKYKIYI